MDAGYAMHNMLMVGSGSRDGASPLWVAARDMLRAAPRDLSRAAPRDRYQGNRSRAHDKTFLSPN